MESDVCGAMTPTHIHDPSPADPIAAAAAAAAPRDIWRSTDGS